MERVKLKKLLKNIPDLVVKGSKEIEITGICSNSKLVAPGNLFIAKKGLTQDGARFIPDAVSSGAAAVLTDFYDPFYRQVVQVIVPDVAAVESLLAQEYYHRASNQLFLVGITGTNGKTTTAYLVKHLLDHMGLPCGLIGTIEWVVGQHLFPATQTTPDVITNYKLFHEMVAQSCQSCVMEVSSHALDQKRVGSIEFDVAVFTNLTQDHLDYHLTMEAYAQAKAKLFSSLKKGEKSHLKTAVINTDSPYAGTMIKDCTSALLTYAVDNPADLRAADISFSPNGTRCSVHYQGKDYSFSTPLIGRHNIYNLLAAAAVGLAKGHPLEEILKVLSEFPKIQGRLERVENDLKLNIFVDYAHTDDALANVLKTLREIVQGRLITVFGCGGNRDQAKRPKMGAVTESLSDVTIVTSDNPRSEDPLEIISHILSGFKEPAKALCIPDREEAIRTAISLCTPEDILLIAGKGHETYQIFSQRTISFDDRRVAREACQFKIII